MKKSVFLIAFCFINIALFLISCSSTKIVHELYYDLDCKNCGTTPDGILTLDIPKSVDPQTYLRITIKNNSNDILLFDEKYFTLTQNDYLVQNPIGYDNPNLSYSWTNMYSSTEGESTPYLYSTTYRYWRKYESQSTLSKSYTETTVPQSIFILPAKSTFSYILNDYYNILLEKYKRIYTKYSIKGNYIQWEKVKESMAELAEDDFKFSVVYRLINENKWNTATIIVKPTSMIIKEREINY